MQSRLFLYLIHTMRNIVIPFFFIACAASARAQVAVNVSDSNFIFEVLIDTAGDDPHATHICVLSMKDHREVQQIVPEENSIWSPVNRIKDFLKRDFIVEDMNFDGYNDFRLLEYMPAFAYNANYYDWIFDPSTGQFSRDTLLEQVYGPTFERNSKQVIYSWREPGNFEHYGTDIYEYVSGRITLVESEENIPDYREGKEEPDYITIRKKLVNGEMVEVK